jgi:hypothetical protein
MNNKFCSGSDYFDLNYPHSNDSDPNDSDPGHGLRRHGLSTKTLSTHTIYLQFLKSVSISNIRRSCLAAAGIAVLGSFLCYTSTASAEQLKHQLSSSTTPSVSTSASAAAAPKPSELASLSGKEVSPQDQLLSEKEAGHLAQQHLALQNYTWGKPVAVQNEGDLYVFGYETPTIEMRLIGQRRVSVSKHTGLTKIVARR